MRRAVPHSFEVVLLKARCSGRSWALLVVGALAFGAVADRPAASAREETFAVAGRSGTAALLRDFYAGGGLWRLCSPADCGRSDQDWGADSLTYALAFRERTTADPALV